MNYKNTICTIFFLVIYFTHFYGQNHVNYSNVSINVNVDINSGKLEINPLDIQNLKVSIYGSVDIFIYGTYDSFRSELPTEKRVTLSVSPNFIYTTLAPIIIPPTPPPTARSQSIRIDEEKVLLGRFNLGLTNPNYIVTRGEHIFKLNISEEFNRIVTDQQEITIDIFDPQDLADLIVTNAEILKNDISGIIDGVIIKTYIMNAGREDITKKSKVKFYYKINNELQLLGSTLLESLDTGERKSIILSIKGSIYQNIVNDYIYIVADADDDIFELSNNNNILEYYVPEIELGKDNIKTHPNPFEKTVNFTFFMNNESSFYASLTIYDYNLNVRGKKRYRITPGDAKKMISYSDSSLPAGKYIYNLLIENIQYYGSIIKK
ncbi:hypothetical protein [uncultured Aquimarina sp.]|uniref:hypothetical protein n=1 Tax=uncultured Aquimarina sp. TaxID=575652 RepID=UPI00260EC3C7|nr:hypothetical protein [uncultured Aquimarina sp.]